MDGTLLNLSLTYTPKLSHNIKYCTIVIRQRSSSQPFPKRQSLDASKLKEFADDSFRSDQNDRKFS